MMKIKLSMKINLTAAAIFLSLVQTSCFMPSEGESQCSAAYIDTPIVIDADGSPAFLQNVPGDYYLCEPWSYNNPVNSGRRYPLFIYLHGSGSGGGPGILPCLYSDRDKKNYPAFVYVPHTPGSWNNSTLISQIESLKTAYPRIDVSRIYLMGYSMGGSGAYSLANAYYDYNGHLFAAIVRMAGQGNVSVRNAIADKTSIWTHVGLSDDAIRVTSAQDSYKFLKDYPGNAGAGIKYEAVPITAYPGITYTLTKGCIENVKYTEYYAPVGHGISHLPLSDPYLLEWLFSQSLENR